MTPHSIRMLEGAESLPHPVSGTGAPAAGASRDARLGAEASPAQHPTRPSLRLHHDHTEEPQPGDIDALALVTLMCTVRELQSEVATLKKQVRDINHREAV